MKKFICVTALVLSLAGCLNTQNRKIEMKTGVSSINSGVWWRTPYTADLSRDKNPWLSSVPKKPISDEAYFEENIVKWPKKMPKARTDGTEHIELLIRRYELQRLLRKLRKSKLDTPAPQSEAY
jgi:hypothetical protein